jgi:antitoxin component of MazEF toxin-antitoxin module
MSALILRLSSEPVISLPADLAQRAGWQEGTSLQVVVSAQGLALSGGSGLARRDRLADPPGAIA